MTVQPTSDMKIITSEASESKRQSLASGTDRLNVLFADQSVQVELTCGRKLAWSGPWHWEVRHNGEPALPISSWESTCWVSDADARYLELEIRLSGGLRIQRHLLLARKDRFLFLADAVLGDRPGKIEYRGILPLAPGVKFRGADESREGRLVCGTSLAQVLPLALPEWRLDVRMGELTATDQGLELRQTIEGRRLFAPLFFDLDPRRFRRRLTWRQLTVGENLAALPADAAVGYRVAVGKQQWLIYRSLGPKGNRTVLGHNLATETLIAKFEKGEVETIMEIE